MDFTIYHCHWNDAQQTNPNIKFIHFNTRILPCIIQPLKLLMQITLILDFKKVRAVFGVLTFENLPNFFIQPEIQKGFLNVNLKYNNTNDSKKINPLHKTTGNNSGLLNTPYTSQTKVLLVIISIV